MKGVRVALRMCTCFGGLLTQVPGHVRIHIREELRQWRLGSFLCLCQRIYNLGKNGHLMVCQRESRPKRLKLSI